MGREDPDNYGPPDPKGPRVPLLSARQLDKEIGYMVLTIRGLRGAYPEALRHGLELEQLMRAEDRGSSARGSSDPAGESVVNRRRQVTRVKIRRACSEVLRAREALDTALAACREASEIEVEKVDWYEELKRMSHGFKSTVSDKELEAKGYVKDTDGRWHRPMKERNARA